MSKRKSYGTYYVLSNSEGTILAVYGNALLSEAQEQARKIEHATGLGVYLHHVSMYGRPHIGQSISMKGAKVVR